jgi:L-iditol 2-dehydrogenase
VIIGAPDDRLALARDMGATPSSRSRMTVEERVDGLRAHRRHGRRRRRRGRRLAACIEEGVLLARNGGAYVIAGHYTNTGDSTINAHTHINRKHLDIRGCWGSEAGHFLRALRALERYEDVPWARIGARTYGLDQLNDALGAAEDGDSKALVDPWR